ncbi:MAG: 1-acyl-sn-glycerol-3-phosphate acyltransferase [Acidimicrobiaceae bacterium]|nr:1-acyl-sn-glycerol-3-phosphate acyltransferase [Acidimicrobiaceae bacterium]
MTSPDTLPGAVPPRRRLPVTPEALRSSLARLPRPRGGFPLTAPTWPGTLPRPVERSTLGAAYDSGWARTYPARFARVLLVEFVTRPGVALIARPKVEGLDRIAHLHEPAIFAANHSSHVDTPLLLSVLPDRWRHHTVVAGAADYFFDTRLKSTLFALSINAIPLERTRVSRESVNRAAALVRDGWSLVIFPEGGRSPDGWAHPHTAGAAWLAVRTGRPVVPVHLAGTRDILPRNSSRLRPGPTQVTFGRPIRPGADTDARELAARVEASIARLADERSTDWWAAARRAAAGETPDPGGPPAAAWRRAWALPGRDRPTGGDSRRWPRA